MSWRVGIVGGNAERGWAKDAHVPALRRLSSDFTISAVSARNQALAEQARAAFGAGKAFGDSLALVRSDDVDVVAVTVKVPEHRAVVLAALAAGKHVYCEWPLGRDVGEAEEMTAAVRPDTHVMIGLQALSSPAVARAAKLVADGAIGRPMVLRVFSPTAGWGAEAPPFYAYLQDRRNGATLETIAGGHSLAVMEALAGAYTALDARTTILRPRVKISGTNQEIERSCADHMMVIGKHESGCVSTLEVTGGGIQRPFLAELQGETGWLRLTLGGGGGAGGFQAGALALETSTGETVAAEEGGTAVNVAAAWRRFAEDLRAGTRTVPDFSTAVALSKLLERIDQSAG